MYDTSLQLGGVWWLKQQHKYRYCNIHYNDDELSYFIKLPFSLPLQQISSDYC